MATVYIGLGSNLGPRKRQIARAIRSLESLGKVMAVSQVRETRAVGHVHQRNFINAVAKMSTQMPPEFLLAALKEIEHKMGRRPVEKWGPRQMDLDLLAYDDLLFQKPHLEIPHPRMHERKFVLEPFADLNPRWVHPRLGLSVKTLLQQLH